MIGSLILGKFYCRPCAQNPGVLFRSEEIPVVEKNIIPHSQTCNKCRKLIVVGITKNEMFPCDAAITLSRADVTNYCNKMISASGENDGEAYASWERQAILHFFRAVEQGMSEDSIRWTIKQLMPYVENPIRRFT